jgi:hypothetical protein
MSAYERAKPLGEETTGDVGHRQYAANGCAGIANALIVKRVARQRIDCQPIV